MTANTAMWGMQWGLPLSPAAWPVWLHSPALFSCQLTVVGKQRSHAAPPPPPKLFWLGRGDQVCTAGTSLFPFPLPLKADRGVGLDKEAALATWAMQQGREEEPSMSPYPDLFCLGLWEPGPYGRGLCFPSLPPATDSWRTR